MPTATQTLLEPDFLARLEQLELVSRKIFQGRMKGEKRSKRKGQSVERGAGGHDVVDDCHVLAAYLAQYRERIADVSAPRIEIELCLRCRVPGALNQRCVSQRAEPARKRFPDRPRLVCSRASSGAVATAAALFHREQLPPARETVAIISGGNVEPAVLRSVLNEATPSS